MLAPIALARLPPGYRFGLSLSGRRGCRAWFDTQSLGFGVLGLLGGLPSSVSVRLALLGCGQCSLSIREGLLCCGFLGAGRNGAAESKYRRLMATSKTEKSLPISSDASLQKCFV